MNSNSQNVFFEKSVVLDLNTETLSALQSQQFMSKIHSDAGCPIQVEEKKKILSVTDLTLHRLERELDTISNDGPNNTYIE